MDLPLYNSTYGTIISWSSSNANTISDDGILNALYVDEIVTLTATISLGLLSGTIDFEVIAKAKYKTLNAPIASSYIYTNYSKVNSTYFETMDIINCAFTIADTSANLTSTTFFNNVNNYIINNAHNAGCYVIMSIGPSSEWTTIANPSNNLVDTFAANIVNAINAYHFDGVDIDWEFPSDSQKIWFTMMMNKIYNAVKANNPHHLVTAAIGGGMWQPAKYDLDNSKIYLDYINVMCYDMIQNNGSYQNALYRTNNYHNPTFNVGRSYTASCSIDETVAIFTSTYSIPNDKILVGIPFYAVRQTREYSNGAWTNWTKAGTNNYQTIKSLMDDDNYSYYFDDLAKVPYIVKKDGTEFYSFDDSLSISYKCDYINSNNLAGIFYWQNGSDTTGELLGAIKTNLGK